LSKKKIYIYIIIYIYFFFASFSNPSTLLAMSKKQASERAAEKARKEAEEKARVCCICGADPPDNPIFTLCFMCGKRAHISCAWEKERIDGYGATHYQCKGCRSDAEDGLGGGVDGAGRDWNVRNNRGCCLAYDDSIFDSSDLLKTLAGLDAHFDKLVREDVMTQHQQRRLSKKVDDLRKRTSELHFVALMGWAQPLLESFSWKAHELPDIVEALTSDDADEEAEEASRAVLEDHLANMVEACVALLQNPHLVRGPAYTMRKCREAATFWSDYTGNATAVKTDVFVEQLEQLLNEDAGLLGNGIITAGDVAKRVAAEAGRVCDGYLNTCAQAEKKERDARALDPDYDPDDPKWALEARLDPRLMYPKDHKLATFKCVSGEEFREWVETSTRYGNLQGALADLFRQQQRIAIADLFICSGRVLHAHEHVSHLPGVIGGVGGGAAAKAMVDLERINQLAVDQDTSSAGALRSRPNSAVSEGRPNSAKGKKKPGSTGSRGSPKKDQPSSAKSTRPEYQENSAFNKGKLREGDQVGVGDGLVVSLQCERAGFKGQLPSTVDALMLKRFNMSYNNLQGNIPDDMYESRSLVELALSCNILYGEISPKICNLWHLQYLYLDNNMLTGPIPPSIGYCYELKHLHLSHNKLSGQLPPQLGNCHHLESLQVTNNALTGEQQYRRDCTPAV
jgi:hypothetical protein